MVARWKKSRSYNLDTSRMFGSSGSDAHSIKSKHHCLINVCQAQVLWNV